MVNSQFLAFEFYLSDADPPIDETASSLNEICEAVARLKGGKGPGVWSISSELLRAGDPATIRGLHIVFPDVWKSGTHYSS